VQLDLRAPGATTAILPLPFDLFVDINSTSATEDGSFENPYHSINTAVAAIVAQPDATASYTVFLAGGDYSAEANTTILSTKSITFVALSPIRFAQTRTFTFSAVGVVAIRPTLGFEPIGVAYFNYETDLGVTFLFSTNSNVSNIVVSSGTNPIVNLRSVAGGVRTVGTVAPVLNFESCYLTALTSNVTSRAFLRYAKASILFGDTEDTAQCGYFGTLDLCHFLLLELRGATNPIYFPNEPRGLYFSLIETLSSTIVTGGIPLDGVSNFLGTVVVPPLVPVIVRDSITP
jgi:hypothetical protein